jgi:hypothetical protein
VAGGAGDVRHVRRAKGARDWSAPVAVNSEPQSAIAMGTIRGAQLASGKDGSLHVVWNGAMKSGGNGSPLFYARLEAGQAKFTPQRNLLGNTGALDGGASVAARRPYVVNSACAVANVSPSARVPKIVISGPERGAWSRTAVFRGTHISCDTGNAKPSRITPTIVA